MIIILQLFSVLIIDPAAMILLLTETYTGSRVVISCFIGFTTCFFFLPGQVSMIITWVSVPLTWVSMSLTRVGKALTHIFIVLTRVRRFLTWVFVFLTWVSVSLTRVGKALTWVREVVTRVKVFLTWLGKERIHLGQGLDESING
ncbi:hypothetical protein [Sunxiuqinia dokdonensis]|nr:hypothetical protein [Sunxiuqinia dokdonensis]